MDPNSPASLRRQPQPTPTLAIVRISPRKPRNPAGFAGILPASYVVIRPPNLTATELFEDFRLPEFDQATHSLPVHVAVRGQPGEVTLSPRMILVLSRKLRNSRISIQTTFEPRSDLTYCAISGVRYI
ncbi:hypothetical protein L3X38_042312 [Prunus dulcis]|uniref:Uncharacterized protein n=1 Tax=Prunus dulcis TaxID=3755 RepID=A0AAD4UVP5_PRUDU|nr:hypothetical protein L3X38_042312 [Prunus dulcis]